MDASSTALTSAIKALPRFPSDEQIAAVVALVVDEAMTRPKPRMSLMALRRHKGSEFKVESVRDRVMTAALRGIDEALRQRATRRAGAPDDGSAEWLTVEEYARRKPLSVKEVYRRLRDPIHRERMGWPTHDGYRWSIPAWVLDATRSAALFAALPDREPKPHLLPAECVRQDAVLGETQRSALESSDAGELQNSV